MMTYGVVFFQCKMRQQERDRTRVQLEYLNWELFDPSHYSPYLAQSYCHLFTYIKNWSLSNVSTEVTQFKWGLR
jgi:hypothetical protein